MRAIEFTERDVMRDRAALRRMLTMTGRHSVPVVVVSGRVIVGWDRKEFDRLYGLPSENGPRAPKR